MPQPVESFATVEQADAYNASVLFGTAWAPVTPERKAAALFTASQLLNAYLPLAYDPAAIPASLVNATSEYARILIERGDPTAPAKNAGIKSFKMGPMDVTFDTTSPKPTGYATVIPAHVVAMISDLIVTKKMSPVKAL